MSFTALHRLLGIGPGPFTDGLIDDAVTTGAAETDGVDWKAVLPPAKGLAQTDFPKDVAAMANSGGGVIVFGVSETQKVATGRVDAGEFDEAYERSLHSVAITAISPPIFGLNIHPLGSEGNRAVVIEVPASVDGPHLIYRNQYFGAPMRNDADTVWMKAAVSPPHGGRIACGINPHQRGFFANAHNLGNIHRARSAWRSARGRCDQARRQATGDGQAQKPRVRCMSTQGTRAAPEHHRHPPHLAIFISVISESILPARER